VAFAFTLPLNLLAFFARPVLEAVGQEPEVAKMAAPYVHILMIHYFFITCCAVSQRVLQVVKYETALTFIQIFSSLASMLVSWLLVVRLDYGYLGAAWSQALLAVLEFSGCFFLLIYSGYSSILRPQKLQILFHLPDVRKYMKLTLPLLADTMVTWWSLEFCVLLVGLLPKDLVNTDTTAGIAATSIFVEVYTIIFFVFIATGNGANIRVGLHIGAQSKRKANAAVWITMVRQLIFGAGSLPTTFLTPLASLPSFCHFNNPGTYD